MDHCCGERFWGGVWGCGSGKEEGEACLYRRDGREYVECLGSALRGGFMFAREEVVLLGGDERGGFSGGWVLMA